MTDGMSLWGEHSMVINQQVNTCYPEPSVILDSQVPTMTLRLKPLSPWLIQICCCLFWVLTWYELILYPIVLARIPSVNTSSTLEVSSYAVSILSERCVVFLQERLCGWIRIAIFSSLYWQMQFILQRYVAYDFSPSCRELQIQVTCLAWSNFHEVDKAYL